jgi:hypothetical protein
MFPRQHVLKSIYLDHTRPFNELRHILTRMKDDCMELLDNEHDAEQNIEQALDI